MTDTNGGVSPLTVERYGSERWKWKNTNADASVLNVIKGAALLLFIIQNKWPSFSVVTQWSVVGLTPDPLTPGHVEMSFTPGGKWLFLN